MSINNDINIECPHCGESFQLTEALAAPMLQAERDKAKAEADRHVARERAQIEANAKAEVERQLAEVSQGAAAAKAESVARIEAAKNAELSALKAKEESEQALRDVELTVQRKVNAQRTEIARKAAEQVNAEAAARIKSVEEQLAAKDKKLLAAQHAEVEARRLKTEADEAKREVELRVSRQIDEERTKVRDAAIKERDDANRLKLAEKDKQLETLREQIEELRRKGNGGSEQLAGDVLELDLMQVLQQAFPHDRFERVAKGQNGADLLHTVLSASGARCGTIMWETKRTKTWQNSWLAKLREDQRAAKADIAALATETLPASVTTFAEIDNVWVTSLSTIVPVAAALRHALIEVGTARRVAAVADTAKDQVFGYLTSSPFRQRVTRIVEGYSELRADLDRERKAMTLLWNKREKQLDRVLGGLTGLYGDLQGIVGPTLPALDMLELPGRDEKPQLAVVGSDLPPSNEPTRE
jgi:hypothetical protein